MPDTISNHGFNENNINQVSKENPCPICGKPDWCGTVGPKGSPTLAICMREQNDHPTPQRGLLLSTR